MSPMVQVQGLAKRFGPTSALGGISFDIAKGELVGLLGPNGAGKTTCLRILCGYLAPSAGAASVGGADVVERSRAVRRKVGYLPEGAPLHGELRVSEQLRFAAQIRGLRGKQLRAEIATQVERCDIGDVQRRIVSQLSKGYRQRVGLACALLGGPELLVLDEPTAGLDPNQIRDVRSLLRDLAGEQTIIFSSHILSQVEALCERVLILDRGELVADGAVSEVCGGGALLLEVRGEEQALLDLLSALPDVDTVTLLGLKADEGLEAETLRLRVEGDFEGEQVEGLAKAIHEAGFGLRALGPEHAALEHVFARLTGREEGSVS